MRHYKQGDVLPYIEKRKADSKMKFVAIIVAVVLLLSVLFLFICTDACADSCASGVEAVYKWTDMNKNHKELKGQVEYSIDENDNPYLTYKGEIYVYDDLNIFNSHDFEKDGDIMISWDTIPLGLYYWDIYYSDSFDKPLYIYMSRMKYDIFLHSDYDYKTDTFILEGTTTGFVFSDVFKPSDFEYDTLVLYPNETKIELYSQQFPKLSITLHVFEQNGVWYAGGGRDEAIFAVSDEFVNFMTENRIISLE